MSTASAVVSVGYKQTEVGVIPEDWNVVTGLEMTVLISKGASPKWQGFSYCDFGMLFVTSENVRDGYLDVSKPKYLPLEFHEKLHRTKLRKNDILINLVGASIGRSCRVSYEIGHANVNQAVAVFRVGTNYSAEFVIQVFQLRQTVERILDMQVDAARPNLSLTNLREFRIPLPILAEQKVMATALSESDSHIQSIEKIIEKKRDIKQSVMQELLTGKTRLPGFNGKWKNYNLIDVAKIIAGINKPASEMGQGVLYLTVKELYVGNYIDTKLLGRIRVSENEIDSKSLVLGDVIFGKSSVKREGIAYPNYFSGCSEPVIFSGFTFCARSNKSLIHARFLFYVLRFERTRNWVINNSQASALTNLNQSIAEQIPITMPVEKDEQEAIAEILSDMDAEIAGLEERLEKAKAIKQGMMQQLLTGKIRLVEPQTSQEVSA